VYTFRVRKLPFPYRRGIDVQDIPGSIMPLQVIFQEKKRRGALAVASRSTIFSLKS
jgi:hypothetical protein